MKKILFILLALTISQPAMASWEKVGGGSYGQSYIDITRIEKYNYLYQSIWTLQDLNSVNQTASSKKPYRSVVSRLVVDCTKKQSTIIALYFYPEPMGKGEIVESAEFPPIRFESSPPNSVAESYHTLACLKK